MDVRGIDREAELLHRLFGKDVHIFVSYWLGSRRVCRDYPAYIKWRDVYDNIKHLPQCRICGELSLDGVVCSKCKRTDNSRRAALRRNALGSFTHQEWQAKLEEYNYKCAYCGNPLDEDITIDHITPISRGGSHNINNLAPAHKVCNSSKYNKTLEEYWYHHLTRGV